MNLFIVDTNYAPTNERALCTEQKLIASVPTARDTYVGVTVKYYGRFKLDTM